MNLKGKKVTLRAIEKEDMEFLRNMINDGETEKYVVGWSFPTSKYEQEKWYENQILDKKTIRLMAEVENQPIGIASINNIDWKNRKAGHGIKLYNEKVKRKGYGTDIVETIMRYAFEELQLNKLYTTILEYNEPSRKLYTKCGWKEEGILRESVFKNNQFINEMCFGITKSDYEDFKNVGR